jgi:hypothetical protein
MSLVTITTSYGENIGIGGIDFTFIINEQTDLPNNATFGKNNIDLFNQTESPPFSLIWTGTGTIPPCSSCTKVSVIIYNGKGDPIAQGEFTYLSTPVPVSNICFLGNTPITTDQGNMAIEDIDPELYTIDGEAILAITKTKTKDYLVCFEKDALYRNVPSQKTIMSKTHKVCHLGKMKEAYQFCNITDKVYKIPYEGQTLYNVLMEKHRTMKVNNLICETLHPKHEMVKINLNK